jgi:hypothetical protein
MPRKTCEQIVQCLFHIFCDETTWRSFSLSAGYFFQGLSSSGAHIAAASSISVFAYQPDVQISACCDGARMLQIGR